MIAQRGIDRRTWLRTVGGGVVALGIGCRTTDAQAAEVVTRFFGELTAGTRIDRWTLVAVHPVTHGAVPVVLQTADGTRYQVDVLARDPDGPAAVAQTESLSLYVANRGEGATPTDEEQGLGAIALAQRLAQREADGARLPGLLTFRDRQAQHPDGSFGVPLS